MVPAHSKLTSQEKRVRPGRSSRPAALEADSGSEAKALIESATRLTNLGCWSSRVPFGQIRLSEKAEEILGFGAGQFDGRFDSWFSRIHPEDQEKFSELEAGVRVGRHTFSYEYRFTTPGGVEKRLKSDGEALLDERGTLTAVAGTLIEVPPAEGRRSPAEALARTPPADDVGYEYVWEQDQDFRFVSFAGGGQMPIFGLLDAVGLRRWEMPNAVPLRGTWKEHIDTLHQRRPFRAFEYRIGTGADTAFLSTSGDPVFDSAGCFAGYRGTGLNITSRVLAEEEARQSRILLEHAARLGKLGAWALRVPEMDVTWSHASRAVLGYPGNAQLSWQQALLHLDGPGRQALERALDACVNAGEEFSVEARAVTPRGAPVWLRIVGEAERHLRGPVRRVLGSIQDITEQRMAREALMTSEERHRMLFETAMDATMQTTADGRILAANPAACAMFGLTEAELRARGRAGVVAPDDQRLPALLRELDASRKCFTQLTLVRGDGSRFEAEVAIARYGASDGRMYAVVVARDITERVQHQAQIRALNDNLAKWVLERTTELEIANRELKGFARSLAHDLRQPIAAAKAFSNALALALSEGREGESRQYAAQVTSAVKTMDAYVEALLSLAHISQVSLEIEEVDLGAIADALLDQFQAQAPERKLVRRVQPEMYAEGDVTLLRMLLQNLLGNAWKFTARREVAKISFTAEECANGQAVYVVRDNGAGFDMARADKLFGTFQRLHDASEFPGTGIGLTNAQRIVTRHGGRIWAESSPGAGATFRFTLGEPTGPQSRLLPL